MPIMFHLVYLVTGAALFWLSLRMRQYQNAPGYEVRGRFKRRANLWL